MAAAADLSNPTQLLQYAKELSASLKLLSSVIRREDGIQYYAIVDSLVLVVEDLTNPRRRAELQKLQARCEELQQQLATIRDIVSPADQGTDSDSEEEVQDPSYAPSPVRGKRTQHPTAEPTAVAKRPREFPAANYRCNPCGRIFERPDIHSAFAPHIRTMKTWKPEYPDQPIFEPVGSSSSESDSGSETD